MKVHHISLLTGDFDKNYHFYVDILGLRLVKNSVNQGNIYMRHVYYGDFLGSPGTVVTFFPDRRFNHSRVEGKSAWSGIKFFIPQGSKQFWIQRFEKFDLKVFMTDDGLSVNDFDNISLELIESEEKLSDWHINLLSEIPEEMQIIGLKGTNLFSADVEKTKRFLSDMVGDFSSIELIESSKNSPSSQWGKGSVDHIAFAVESAKELDEIWEKAQNLGYTRESYVDRGYFSSVYLLTPEGNRLEFATLTPGFALDESIQDLGTTFALPPRYESRRAELVRYFEKQGVNFKQVSPVKFTDNVTVKKGDVQRDQLHL